MKIFHRPPELKGTQHIPVNINIAGEISITDLTFIDASNRAQTLAIFDCDAKAGIVGSKPLHLLVG